MKFYFFLIAGIFLPNISQTQNVDSIKPKPKFLIEYAPIMQGQHYSAAATNTTPMHLFYLNSYLRAGYIHKTNIGVGLSGNHWFYDTNVPNINVPENPVGGFGGFIRFYPFFLRNDIFEKVELLKSLAEFHFNGYFQLEVLQVNYVKQQDGTPEALSNFSATQILPAFGMDFKVYKFIYANFWAGVNYIKQNKNLSYHGFIGTLGLLAKF